MSNDLQVMTFSSQALKSPQKVTYHDITAAQEVHHCVANSYDSIFMFLHNTSADEIPVYVYQKEFPYTAPATLFKHINVLPKGNHQNLLFNGHTMFQNQKLYLVVANANDEDKVFYTGYVKRFTI